MKITIDDIEYDVTISHLSFDREWRAEIKTVPRAFGYGDTLEFALRSMIASATWELEKESRR